MRWNRLIAVTTVPALAVAGLGVASGPASADWAPQDPTDPATPVTVTADALPTVQIDGVVWSQDVRGDIAYAGGDFDNARPAGATTDENVPRSNFIAYDLDTGEMTDFDPAFNGQIRAVDVSPDGSRLYVGGEFTQVDGVPRNRIAAFDLPSGELVEGFSPQVNGNVQAIAATDSTVYVGGGFGSVGNQTRGNLAAFDADGTLLPWAPTVAGGGVLSIAVKPDGSRIAVGGSFLEVNGETGQDDKPEAAEPGDGLALFDAAGAAQPLPAGQYLYNGNGEGDADGAITALAADESAFYGTGYTYSSIDAGTVEGTFAVTWDGTLHWVADCHGDSYAVLPTDESVYVAGHSHYCENMGGVTQGAGGVGDYPYYRGVAYSTAATGTATYEPDNRRYFNFEGQPTPSMLTWFPSINAGTFTGQSQGPWSVAGNDDYVVMGGEFTRVNGEDQQGLVRFPRAEIAPKAEGPTRFNATFPLVATSTEAGTVRLGWASNEDIDNSYLEYRLQRRLPGGNAELVESRWLRADFWNPLGMTHTDTDVEEGETYEYRVQTRDPGGLTANTAWTPVTVSADGAPSAYTAAVHDDQPTHWWRFGEETSATGPAADHVSSNGLALGAGVTRGTQGAVGSDAGSATGNRGATFPGTATGVATSTVQDSPPDLFTLEAWFRTTSTTGGRIVARDTGSGFRAKVDRALYLDATGRVVFDVKPDAERTTVASAAGLNDGEWHHVAGVLSPEGMRLFVDGAEVGSSPDTTVGEHLAVGYWKVGGGSAVTGLPGAFQGDIDEVALYKRALSATEIAEHVAAAGEVAPNEAPTAALTATAEELRATLDGSASTDPDGSVATYQWSFGDGTTATTDEPTTTHDYVNAGTYTVGLTVIDDAGRASKEVTAQVTTVDSSNVAPVAAFTASGPGLRPTFDGATSSDPDGTVTGWRWSFGDGRTGSGTSARARYAAVGTYRVTLTVTDNDGATHEVAKDVTISETAEPVLTDPPPNEPPTADFTSTVSGLTATFSSTADDPEDKPLTYAWDFGDGGTSTQPSPSRTYAAAGTYTVRLTVTDEAGASVVVTKPVTVAAPPVNQAPRASFTARLVGPKVTLASTSTDDKGIRSVRWTFGDGRTSTATRVTHTYAAARSYTVRLTVTDTQGKTATAARTVTVRKVAVRATLRKVTSRPQAGRPVVFQARLVPSVPVTLRGTLKVYDGNRLKKTIRVSRSTVGVRIWGLKAGWHRVRVVYTGSPVTHRDPSNTIRVWVRRR